MGNFKTRTCLNLINVIQIVVDAEERSGSINNRIGEKISSGACTKSATGEEEKMKEPGGASFPGRCKHTERGKLSGSGFPIENENATKSLKARGPGMRKGRLVRRALGTGKKRYNLEEKDVH